ncbi:dUTP diphosphatase [Selenomonas sp. TAMA-11512]|uniref:dUTP diphosphatase n=1 Tax=Selenomonas sp. TAMA-11512 TaxID=3095337 RepID=UPI003091E6D8|nr:dUTP diphosphatase [Selenomonas sp. TAMA-11512]
MRKRGFEIAKEYTAANIILPARKTARSAGYDLAAAADIVLKSMRITLVPTGLKAYMQPDEYLGIHIRSSLALKHGLSLINNVGIVDSDYYENEDNDGHILLPVMNFGQQDFSLKAGMRIAQGIFYKYLTADNEQQNELIQRTGGFGSTGI